MANKQSTVERGGYSVSTFNREVAAQEKKESENSYAKEIVSTLKPGNRR